MNACDPLNLFGKNDPVLSLKVNSIMDKFFQKVVDLTAFFPSAQVFCVIPGPRFLKSVDDHKVYNALCYVLQWKFYKFAFGKRVVLINNFLKEWVKGSKNLLCVHSFREQLYVTFQHVRPTRYGAVHYNRLKYQEMYDAISVALDHNEPLISKTWEKDNGVFIHFLLGNKGAHFYNGNIATSIKNQRDGDSSKKDVGNISFFQHFMLGNKGGHLIHGNINFHSKKQS